VLGVGGRLAMRVIAVAAGSPGSFSLGGTVEVLVAAALYGAAGGLVLAAFSNRLGLIARALATASALFAFAFLVSGAARSAAAAVPDRVRLALVLFAALFVLYGLLASVLALRFGVESPPSRPG
jgi:hypothetical protein